VLADLKYVCLKLIAAMSRRGKALLPDAQVELTHALIFLEGGVVAVPTLLKLDVLRKQQLVVFHQLLIARGQVLKLVDGFLLELIVEICGCH